MLLVLILFLLIIYVLSKIGQRQYLIALLSLPIVETLAALDSIANIIIVIVMLKYQIAFQSLLASGQLLLIRRRCRCYSLLFDQSTAWVAAYSQQHLFVLSGVKRPLRVRPMWVIRRARRLISRRRYISLVCIIRDKLVTFSSGEKVVPGDILLQMYCL